MAKYVALYMWHRASKYALVHGSTLEKMRARFEARLIGRPVGECWSFRKSLKLDYESITVPGAASIGAHVFSFFLATGRWPEPYALVCHKCDHKWCVNPDHLYEGTHRTNSQDRLRALGFEHAEPPAWEVAS